MWEMEYISCFSPVGFPVLRLNELPPGCACALCGLESASNSSHLCFSICCVLSRLPNFSGSHVLIYGLL